MAHRGRLHARAARPYRRAPRHNLTPRAASPETGQLDSSPRGIEDFVGDRADEGWPAIGCRPDVAYGPSSFWLEPERVGDASACCQRACDCPEVVRH